MHACASLLYVFASAQRQMPGQGAYIPREKHTPYMERKLRHLQACLLAIPLESLPAHPSNSAEHISGPA